MVGQVIGRFIGNLPCTSKQWPIARKKILVRKITSQEGKDKSESSKGKPDESESIDNESDNEGGNSKSSMKWPDSLKRYLFAVMEKCSDNPRLKSKVQMRLRRVIESSIEDGTLHTRDWENSPPELFSPKLSWTEKKLPQANSNDFCCEHNEKDGKSSDNDIDSDNDSDNSDNDSDKSSDDDYISIVGVKAKKPISTINVEPPLKKICEDYETSQHFGGGDALQKRLMRFSSPDIQKKSSKNIIDVSKRKNIKKKIVGTCTTLEKPYTRSSVIIDLSTIRPERILHKSFALAVRKHNSGEADYYETNSQLLSIRQDMVLQGIRNSFTVSVYEFHGRLAILNKDLSGFNQCQGKLSTLYTTLPEDGENALYNMPEFLAYRVLYCILLDTQESSLEKTLAEIYERGFDKDSLDVKVAIAVQKYALHRNYLKLFRILEEFPVEKIRDTVLTFVDEIIVKYRDIAVRNIIGAHIGSVTNAMLSRILNFKTDKEYRKFIEHYNPVYDNDKNIDAKPTFGNMLRIPPPKVQVLYTVNQ